MSFPDEELQGSHGAKQQEEFDNFFHDLNFSEVSWKRLIRAGRPQRVVREMPCSIITVKSKEGVPELLDNK